MPYVGGTEVATLVVDDYDDTTVVTLAITKPDGSTATVVVPTTEDGNRTWFATLLYDMAGAWILLWTVTGGGANVKPLLVFVSPNPSAGGPTWRPDLRAVAKYVPGRSLVLNRATGSNELQSTFDGTTTPSDQQVNSLITDAVAWVLTLTGPIAETPTNLAQMATAAAAIWAAAAVERGYPDRDEDVKTAADFLTQATQMRMDLKCANEAATGEDPADPSASLLPLYQFPRRPRWGDLDFN